MTARLLSRAGAGLQHQRAQPLVAQPLTNLRSPVARQRARRGHNGAADGGPPRRGPGAAASTAAQSPAASSCGGSRSTMVRQCSWCQQKDVDSQPNHGPHDANTNAFALKVKLFSTSRTVNFSEARCLVLYVLQTLKDRNASSDCDTLP